MSQLSEIAAAKHNILGAYESKVEETVDGMYELVGFIR